MIITKISCPNCKQKLITYRRSRPQLYTCENCWNDYKRLNGQLEEMIEVKLHTDGWTTWRAENDGHLPYTGGYGSWHCEHCGQQTTTGLMFVGQVIKEKEAEKNSTFSCVVCS